jgi:serine/threonine-protein kinase
VQELQPHEDHLGSYEIVREVNQGAYASVYEARHAKLHERRVALRVLRNNGYAEHFLRAARINAWLEHPRIPRLMEVAQLTGRLYWARSFIEGDDLQNGIRGASRTAGEVVRIIAEVAGVLDYAHGRGVIHGLVHPRHVLLGSDGAGWLIGFGEYPAPSRAFLDNPLHLAPEQLEDGQVTPATDVYCLSETCFWLLCGRHPFEGLGKTAISEAKHSGRLPRGLRERRPKISPMLEQALLRGLSPEPSARHASPGECAARLLEAS